MSKKGGYQILDLKGTPLTVGTKAIIPGIYDTLEGNYGKPILLSGLVIGSTEYIDVWIDYTISLTSFVIIAHGHQLVIGSDDGVTATVKGDPIASALELGMIKVGTGLTISSDGTLSAT